jgi:hypothetical protein
MSGSVGIGTSSPNGRLAVNTGGSNQIAFFNNSTSGGTYNIISLNGSYSEGTNMSIQGGGVGDANLYVNSGYTSSTSGDIIFRNGGTSIYTERMRITSAGNVGIGTSSPSGISAGFTTLDIEGSNGGGFKFGNGTPKAFMYTSADAMDFGTNANAPVRLYTNDTERMRITSGGEFLVGTTTATTPNDPVHRIGTSGGTTYARLMIQERAGTWISLNTGTSNFGTIYLNGSVVVYGGQSDYRLKENIQPMNSGLDRVMNLKPVTFNWKRDNSYGEGFIAHELQEIVPLAVTGTKDGLNEVGDPDWQNVDKSHIIPILVKAIQELKAEIDILKQQ